MYCCIWHRCECCLSQDPVQSHGEVLWTSSKRDWTLYCLACSINTLSQSDTQAKLSNLVAGLRSTGTALSWHNYALLGPGVSSHQRYFRDLCVDLCCTVWAYSWTSSPCFTHTHIHTCEHLNDFLWSQRFGLSFKIESMFLRILTWQDI